MLKYFGSSIEIRDEQPFRKQGRFRFADWTEIFAFHWRLGECQAVWLDEGTSLSPYKKSACVRSLLDRRPVELRYCSMIKNCSVNPLRSMKFKGLRRNVCVAVDEDEQGWCPI